MLSKRCTKCGELKDLTEFRSRSNGNKHSWCIVCHNSYKKNTPPDNRVAHDRSLRHKYGITVEEYEAMLVSQSGACAICGGVEPSGKRLAVDHDHGTGKVRQLLCHRCNLVLGQVHDDPNILRLAAMYLERHEDASI